MKRVMVLTGGGDCPGLNAVIRAIVKRASQETDWEVLGSVKAFDGILNEPTELIILDSEKVAGITIPPSLFDWAFISCCSTGVSCEFPNPPAS